MNYINEQRTVPLLRLEGVLRRADLGALRLRRRVERALGGVLQSSHRIRFTLAFCLGEVIGGFLRSTLERGMIEK